MKDNNYVHCPCWVFNNLNLSMSEALVYSIIFGFSQDNETEFSGSIGYLAEAINVNRSTIKRCLNALVKRRLIIKITEKKQNMTFNRYKVNFNVLIKTEGGYKLSD